MNRLASVCVLSLVFVAASGCQLAELGESANDGETVAPMDAEGAEPVASDMDPAAPIEQAETGLNPAADMTAGDPETSEPVRPVPAVEPQSPTKKEPVSTPRRDGGETSADAPSPQGRDAEPAPSPRATPAKADRPAPSTAPADDLPEPAPLPRAEPEEFEFEPDVVEIIEVELDEGTLFELELLTPLDSSINRVGDEIQARTLSPIFVKGQEVLASGTYIEGRVTEVSASGRVKGRASLGFTFDRLSTRSGVVKIRTSYVSEEAEANTKDDAKKVGGAAGLGAIVGGILGGKKGAAIGATIGGAGGAGVVLSTKGEEVRLRVGTEMNVRLDEAVVITLN